MYMSNMNAALSLSRCVFYVENMLNMQLGKPLVFFSETGEIPIVRERYNIGYSFENVVNRTDLDFPVDGIIFRFQGLANNYGVADAVNSMSTHRESNQLPVREQFETEDQFCLSLFRHHVHAVRSFYYMISLDKYARNKQDFELPVAPAPAEGPIGSSARHLLHAYTGLTDALTMAVVDSFIEDQGLSPMLSEYAMKRLVPDVARYRNVIYNTYCKHV